jgi:hypothetical protein
MWHSARMQNIFHHANKEQRAALKFYFENVASADLV